MKYRHKKTGWRAEQNPGTNKYDGQLDDGTPFSIPKEFVEGNDTWEMVQFRGFSDEKEGYALYLGDKVTFLTVNNNIEEGTVGDVENLKRVGFRVYKHHINALIEQKITAQQLEREQLMRIGKGKWVKKTNVAQSYTIYAMCTGMSEDGKVEMAEHSILAMQNGDNVYVAKHYGSGDSGLWEVCSSIEVKTACHVQIGKYVATATYNRYDEECLIKIGCNYYSVDDIESLIKFTEGDRGNTLTAQDQEVPVSTLRKAKALLKIAQYEKEASDSQCVRSDGPKEQQDVSGVH